MINILGLEMPIAIVVTFIALVGTVLVTNFFVSDVEYLTQDMILHKTRKIVYSFMLWFGYIIFILIVDYIMNFVPVDQRVDGEIYCYLDYLDISNVLQPGLIVVVFLSLYFLPFLYLFFKTRDRGRLKETILRKKKEKEWKKRYHHYVRGSFILKDLKHLVNNNGNVLRYRVRKLIPRMLIFNIRESFSNFVMKMYDLYLKGLAELIGLVGPIIVVFAWQERNQYKDIILILLLVIFTYRSLFAFVSIHFDDINNFELLKEYKCIADFKKEYTGELIWVTNSKRYSIFNVDEDFILVLVHRDSGRIEVAKKHKKYYNYIRRERIKVKNILKDIKVLKKDTKDLGEKMDEIILILSNSINGKEE